MNPHFHIGDKVSCVVKGETVTGVVKSTTPSRSGFDVTIATERNSEITGDQAQFTLIAPATDTPPPPPPETKKPDTQWLWWGALVLGAALLYHGSKRGAK